MECIEYIETNLNITAPYDLIFLMTPVESSVWAPRSAVWNYVFITYTIIFSTVFFKLGVISIAMLIKQDCIRLKAKTFLAIYICLAILGFTHALHLGLDPYGILGWMIEYFPQWNIISRFIVILGFPSLTASYMLVFITLYKSVEIGASRLWHQDWKVVSLIVAGNYVLVLTSEAIANTADYPALTSILICQAAYALWGIALCMVYLFAGCRLIRRLKSQCQASVRMSTTLSSVPSSQSVFFDEQYNRQLKKISQTLRKVAIITYFTSFLSVVYAMISITSLFFISWFIFYQCFGLNDVGNPIIWLTLQISIKSIELLLGVVMLYSITDLKAVCVLFSSCCCPHKSTGGNCTDATGPETIQHTISQSSLASIGTTRSRTDMNIRPHPPIDVRTNSLDDSV